MDNQKILQRGDPFARQRVESLRGEGEGERVGFGASASSLPLNPPLHISHYDAISLQNENQLRNLKNIRFLFVFFSLFFVQFLLIFPIE